MKRNKISIIIPVYNVKDYIVECVGSIMRQSYDNCEVILVDDCSTDGSIEALEGIVAFDNKRIIKVKTDSNSGLSAARNLGLSCATGDYVWFVDSDDFIQSDALEVLNKQLNIDNFDIVIFDINLYYNENNVRRLTDILMPGVYSGEEIVIQTLIKSTPIVACNKIYSRELLSDTNFLFPIGLWYEDTLTINLFTSAVKIKKIDSILYYYRQREGSITKVFSTRLLERYDVFLLVKRHLLSISGRYEQYLELFYGKVFLLETLNNTFLHGKAQEDCEKVNLILKFIKNAPETKVLYKSFWHLPFRKVEKVLLFLYFKSPFLYKFFYTFHKKISL